MGQSDIKKADVLKDIHGKSKLRQKRYEDKGV